MRRGGEGWSAPELDVRRRGEGGLEGRGGEGGALCAEHAGAGGGFEWVVCKR